MKKSLKTLKKELSIAQVGLLKIHIRELLKNRNQKLKSEVNKQVEILEKYINDI